MGSAPAVGALGLLRRVGRRWLSRSHLLIVSLLDVSALWWIGLLLCVVWAATLGIDSLLVCRLQRDTPGWTPWEPRARRPKS